jgi:regulator of sigma E protease
MTTPPEPSRWRLAPSHTPADQEPAGGQRTSTWSWLLLAAIIVALILAKWTLLIAVLGLAFLITIHEFGHFVFAKLFGMRVEKFYVGFPPAAWKRQRGETEYGIGLIPLGGFCRISGMSQDEELPDDVVPRAYFNQPVWKRNVTIAAGPIFNIVAAVVILFVFLMAQGVAKPTLKIDTVAATVQVGKLEQATPAALAGLKPGDTLVGALVLTSPRGQLQTWKTWDAALQFLQANPNRQIELVYRTADGRQHTADLKLGTNPTDPTQGFLGVTAGHRWEHQAPWTAAWLAVKDTGGVIKSTFQGFYWLASGKVSMTGREGAAGPVGIISISSNAVQQGFYPILLALISVNLGILNLIPILPFDGGHIFFNTLERIRGRKIDKRVMERAAAVGVALLLFLFVFLTFNDIRRLFGG